MVLLTGAFVPRDIVGRFLCDHVNEWHKRYLNQLAAASLIHTINKHIVEEQKTATQPIYQLTTTNQIKVLEAELFNLCARKQVPVHANCTHAQKARNTNVEIEEEEVVAATRARPSARIEEVTDEEDMQSHPKTTSRDNALSLTVAQPPSMTDYPFQLAKDAAYSPPTVKNVGLQDKQVSPINKKPEPAYRTSPPIHDLLITETIFKQSMEAPITITQRELLSLSSEVQFQVRKSTTMRHLPNKDLPTTHALAHQETDEGEEVTFPIFSAFSLPEVTYAPDGSVTISDPVETYYGSLPPGFNPVEEALTVSLKSSTIRIILAFVDNNQKMECILDPGCQVVTMSAICCHELGLTYDPSIKLNMQSANGTCNPSLSLACNVPFLIDLLIFYLPVHIIQSPVYDILLD